MLAVCSNLWRFLCEHVHWPKQRSAGVSPVISSPEVDESVAEENHRRDACATETDDIDLTGSWLEL